MLFKLAGVILVKKFDVRVLIERLHVVRVIDGKLSVFFVLIKFLYVVCDGCKDAVFLNWIKYIT